MNLSPRALTTLASPERHTFSIINIYTGKTIQCKFARETKCYYIMWQKLPTHTANQWLEVRFHKATMSVDELNLYIEDTAELKAAARADVAARIAAVKAADHCPNCEQECNTDELTQSAHSDVMYCPECIQEEKDDDAHSAQTAQALAEVDTTGEANLYIATPAPIAHDAPHFCPQCETYNKADEMTTSAWLTALICIDCATDEENALTAADEQAEEAARELLTTIKNVALLNYTLGHLPGFNFTPTVKELPRSMIAFIPNTGRPGSPNALINTLGYMVVKPTPTTLTRVLYNNRGEYVTHGDFDVINTALIALSNGV